MYQLIYISTAQRDLGKQDVDQILTASQRNNARNDISGLLLFDGRRFLQALEGGEAEIGVTFERVKTDPRHRAIVLLSTKTIAQRQFGDWAMALHRVDSETAQRDFHDAVDALTADIADANSRELFRGFARIDRKAA